MHETDNLSSLICENIGLDISQQLQAKVLSDIVPLSPYDILSCEARDGKYDYLFSRMINIMKSYNSPEGSRVFNLENKSDITARMNSININPYSSYVSEETYNRKTKDMLDYRLSHNNRDFGIYYGEGALYNITPSVRKVVTDFFTSNDSNRLSRMSETIASLNKTLVQSAPVDYVDLFNDVAATVDKIHRNYYADDLTFEHIHNFPDDYILRGNKEINYNKVYCDMARDAEANIDILSDKLSREQLFRLFNVTDPTMDQVQAIMRSRMDSIGSNPNSLDGFHLKLLTEGLKEYHTILKNQRGLKFDDTFQSLSSKTLSKLNDAIFYINKPDSPSNNYGYILRTNISIDEFSEALSRLIKYFSSFMRVETVEELLTTDVPLPRVLFKGYPISGILTLFEHTLEQKCRQGDSLVAAAVRSFNNGSELVFRRNLNMDRLKSLYSEYKQGSGCSWGNLKDLKHEEMFLTGMSLKTFNDLSLADKKYLKATNLIMIREPGEDGYVSLLENYNGEISTGLRIVLYPKLVNSCLSYHEFIKNIKIARTAVQKPEPPKKITDISIGLNEEGVKCLFKSLWKDNIDAADFLLWFTYCLVKYPGEHKINIVADRCNLTSLVERLSSSKQGCGNKFDIVKKLATMSKSCSPSSQKVFYKVGTIIEEVKSSLKTVGGNSFVFDMDNKLADDTNKFVQDMRDLYSKKEFTYSNISKCVPDFFMNYHNILNKINKDFKTGGDTIGEIISTIEQTCPGVCTEEDLTQFLKDNICKFRKAFCNNSFFEERDLFNIINPASSYDPGLKDIRNTKLMISAASNTSPLQFTTFLNGLFASMWSIKERDFAIPEDLMEMINNVVKEIYTLNRHCYILQSYMSSFNVFTKFLHEKGVKRLMKDDIIEIGNSGLDVVKPCLSEILNRNKNNLLKNFKMIEERINKLQVKSQCEKEKTVTCEEIKAMGDAMDEGYAEFI